MHVSHCDHPIFNSFSHKTVKLMHRQWIHDRGTLDSEPSHLKFRLSTVFMFTIYDMLPYKNTSQLLYLVYIHKCKASYSQERLQFIKKKPWGFLSAWHSQTYGIHWNGGKRALVPCLVDRTYSGHESQLTLGMKGGWCYLLPYLASHAIDNSHRIFVKPQKEPDHVATT